MSTKIAALIVTKKKIKKKKSKKKTIKKLQKCVDSVDINGKILL